jgi:phosphoglucosamine mutase
MTRRLFGTDGVRGTANVEPMTPETALKVAMAVGECFRSGAHKHLVVIGKDTRLSGYMLEPALTAGFITMGMDVVLVGPLPTPAIAMLTRSLRADIGVVISASHNPYADNGIKLFGRDGYKLSDELEQNIEAILEKGPSQRAAPGELGRAKRLDDAGGRYIEFVNRVSPRGCGSTGCASLSIARMAPPTRSRRPCSGNWAPRSSRSACRPTAPTSTANAVLSLRSDAPGSAGAARRYRHRARRRRRPADVADERGIILDGDQVMALITTSMAQRPAACRRRAGCHGDVQSRPRAISRRAGIGLHRTAVGDRYVVEKMRSTGCNVGGEQSGHIILSDYATTGDGLIAALQVMARIVETGKKASEVCSLFAPVPQLLRNVRFGEGRPMESRRVKLAITAGEARLGTPAALVIRQFRHRAGDPRYGAGRGRDSARQRCRRYLRGDPRRVARR